MPESLPEPLPELLTRLVDLLVGLFGSPTVWGFVGVVGLGAAGLAFLRNLYAVRERERTRRHVADHVANGKLSSEDAATLLNAGGRGGFADDGFRQAAWVMGPIGAVLLVAGIWLGVAAHAAFYVLGFFGLILLTLGTSFGVIASAKLKPDR